MANPVPAVRGGRGTAAADWTRGVSRSGARPAVSLPAILSTMSPRRCSNEQADEWLKREVAVLFSS